MGPRGLEWFEAPKTPEEKAGAFIGSFVSPNVLSKFYKGAYALTEAAAGQATFVGPRALETAYQAGYQGGEAAKAFRENITRVAKLEDVVPEAKASLENIRETRNADYLANKEKLSKDPAILNFDKIDEAIAKATQIKTFRGKDLSPSTSKIRKEMNDIIREWRSSDPALYHTPVGFDALKQRLGDVLENTLRGTPENKAAFEIYQGVRKTILDQAPEYASMMKAYEKASDTIRELESTFNIKNSFKRAAASDTALRKLQSILRDNVNTSYGHREQLAQYLIANGSPYLMEKLAGQALNPKFPRGLGKVSTSIGAQMAAIAAGTAGGAPIATFAAGLALSSPRFMGNMAYLNGMLARYGERIPAGTAARLGTVTGAVPQITVNPRPGYYQEPRSSGGSVLDKMRAAKRRKDGGPLDGSFDEVGVQHTAEGYPYIQAPEEPRPGYLQKSIEGLTRGVRELPGTVARAAEDYWAKVKEEQKHGLEMAGRGISNIAGGLSATGVGEVGLGALQYLASPITGFEKPVEKKIGRAHV